MSLGSLCYSNELFMDSLIDVYVEDLFNAELVGDFIKIEFLILSSWVLTLLFKDNLDPLFFKFFTTYVVNP